MQNPETTAIHVPLPSARITYYQGRDPRSLNAWNSAPSDRNHIQTPLLTVNLGMWGARIVVKFLSKYPELNWQNYKKLAHSPICAGIKLSSGHFGWENWITILRTLCVWESITFVTSKSKAYHQIRYIFNVIELYHQPPSSTLLLWYMTKPWKLHLSHANYGQLHGSFSFNHLLKSRSICCCVFVNQFWRRLFLFRQRVLNCHLRQLRCYG